MVDSGPSQVGQSRAGPISGRALSLRPIGLAAIRKTPTSNEVGRTMKGKDRCFGFLRHSGSRYRSVSRGMPSTTAGGVLADEEF
jgi:hypothetical protein